MALNPEAWLVDSNPNRAPGRSASTCIRVNV